MPVQPLPAEKLYRACPPDSFTFTTTAELEANDDIIGQPRGTRAIEFGIGIRRQGYNVYVLGPVGTGRAKAVELFLQEQATGQPTPYDWIYVHNFSVPHQPRAVELPAGQGIRFQKQMSRLMSELKKDLPQAFETETYRETLEAVQQEFESQRNEMLRDLHQQAAAQGFALLETASGFTVTPVRDGRQLRPTQLQALPIEEQQAVEKQSQSLTRKLEDVLYQIHRLQSETRQKVREIDREVAQAVIQHPFADLRRVYQEHQELLLYLAEVQQDVLEQIDDFAPQADNEEEISLRRYQVNLLVDNSQRQGAPVVVETNPTYHNLFGRLEFEMDSGVMRTGFTNIQGGSLHRANGGYLIMEAHELLRNSDAWEALKRALKRQEIRLQPAAVRNDRPVLAKSLDPELIPLSVKIILLGSANLYYGLYHQDEDFADLFKVRADFDDAMPRDQERMNAYASFVATRCHREGLRHFDRSAVAKVVEFGSRLAEYQKKLSTRFGDVASLIREADYWAAGNGHDVVTAADVQQALSERIYRANQIEEQFKEQILEGSVLIATEGSIVGQVNGLSIFDTGDYDFGQPGRITARTFMGEDGVVHIERETDMSGPIHEKGVLTLSGYLGGTYAQRQPLSLSASLTFEQNYTEVDGDSAASTELYALLSSLSQLPLKQAIAVTGSVNQRGEVQPIGGVNEKIEGFFRVCQARGLTGEQGVIIPAGNAENLMLDEAVRTAVSEGKFHIWPVGTVNEGIELLTGVAAGQPDEKGNYPKDTVHHKVQARLLELARQLKAFGDDEDKKN